MGAAPGQAVRAGRHRSRPAGPDSHRWTKLAQNLRAPGAKQFVTGLERLVASRAIHSDELTSILQLNLGSRFLSSKGALSGTLADGWEDPRVTHGGGWC